MKSALFLKESRLPSCYPLDERSPLPEGSELVSSSPPEVKLLPFLREDARPSGSG